jgi:hypothetical protein
VGLTVGAATDSVMAEEAAEEEEQIPIEREAEGGHRRQALHM